MVSKLKFSDMGAGAMLSTGRFSYLCRVCIKTRQSKEYCGGGGSVAKPSSGGHSSLAQRIPSQSEDERQCITNEHGVRTLSYSRTVFQLFSFPHTLPILQVFHSLFPCCTEIDHIPPRTFDRLQLLGDAQAGAIKTE